MPRKTKAPKQTHTPQFLTFISGDDDVLSLEVLKTFAADEQEQIKTWLLTDTFFASNRIFRNPSLPSLQPFHADIAYSYPQPDPTKKFSDWSQTKERVCLAFRGAAKSTIESSYIAQVILAFPDVRILLVGATLGKSEDTVDAVRQNLNYNPIVGYFFPLAANVPNGKSFTVPTRTNSSLREETLTATSFRACSTGWHGDLILMDDCIHEQNQGTDAAISKSISRYEDLHYMLEPRGYISYTGTRHAINDIPTQMIRVAATNGTPLSLVTVPIYTLKENQANQAEIDARNKTHKLDLQNDIIPTWPDRWPWQTIASKYALENFDRNYLLEIFEAEPEPEIQPVTPELIQSCVTKTVDYLGDVACINADLSMIHPTRGSDYCGIVGGFWNPTTKVLTVNRLLHKKFTDESDFLRQKSAFYRDYCLSVFRIRFRVEANRDEQQLYEKAFNTQQTPAEFLPSLGSKYERVSMLWDAIRSGKVKFSDELRTSPQEWQTLVNQVCHFSGVEAQHDDLVDSLAQLYLYCQTITAAEPSMNVPDFGDEGAHPFPAKPRPISDTAHMRKPDTPQQPPQYSDPFYSRIFSTAYER